MKRRRGTKGGCALSPQMAALAPQLLAAAQSLDPAFRISSGCRTRAEQTALYASYLRGESILPVAPPGRSLHELGLAVDVSRGQDPYSDAALAELGRWWTSGGLGWSPSDPVHFQLPAIRERGQTAAAAALTVGPSIGLATPGPSEYDAAATGLQSVLRTLPVSAGPAAAPLGFDALAGRVEDVVVKEGLQAAATAIPVVGPLLAPLAPMLAKPVEAVISDIGSAISSVFSGGGYSPEELASNEAIRSAAIAAGERYQDASGARGPGGRPERLPLMAGDPGVRHHLGHLLRIAKHICKVIEAI